MVAEMLGLLSLVAAISAAASVVVAGAGLSQWIYRPGTLRHRLQQIVQPTLLQESELHQPFAERALLPILNGLTNLVGGRVSKRSTEKIVEMMRHAGVEESYQPVFLSTFIIARVALSIGMGLLGLLIGNTFGFPLFIILVCGGGGSIFGYFMPRIWLSGKAKRRQEIVLTALPDMVDLLTLCIGTSSYVDAFGILANNTESIVMVKELRYVRNELLAGNPLKDVLYRFADRVGIDELRMLVGTIVQADALGLMMAGVLREQAKDIRNRRRQRAEAIARKAPIKMMIPLILFIFPPLFIVILGPIIPQIITMVLPGVRL